MLALVQGGRKPRLSVWGGKRADVGPLVWAMLTWREDSGAITREDSTSNRDMRPVTNWGQEAICRPFLRILKTPKLPKFKVVMAIDRNKWWFPGSGWKQVLHVWHLLSLMLRVGPQAPGTTWLTPGLTASRCWSGLQNEWCLTRKPSFQVAQSSGLSWT